MAYVKFQKSDKKWWTCGCGGVKKTVQEVPPNSVVMNIYQRGKVKGVVSGLTYLIDPNFSAIDIAAEDADDFVERRIGRLVKPEDYDKRSGKVTRI